ncbi:hypothetical protein Hanom_Chr07g00607521 [Helianthus anomalus]
MQNHLVRNIIHTITYNKLRLDTRRKLHTYAFTIILNFFIKSEQEGLSFGVLTILTSQLNLGRFQGMRYLDLFR